MFKPRADMTLYATFADSIQAPDVAAANSGSIVIINANQALPPYRSKEGEIGYKMRVRRITSSIALFRIDRPFANYATGVVDPICGAQSGTPNCEAFRITGNQRNYGIEAMVSGRIIDSLMITGGLTVLESQADGHRHRGDQQQELRRHSRTTSPIFWPSIVCPKLPGAYLQFRLAACGTPPDRRHQQRLYAPIQPLRFWRPLHHAHLRETDHLARYRQQRHRCTLLVDARARQHHGAEHRQLSGTSGRAAVGDGFRAIRFLGEASMVGHAAFFLFTLSLVRRRSDAELRAAVEPATDHLSCRQSDARFQAAGSRTFTCQTGIQVKDVAMGSVDAGRQITAGGQASDLYAPADYLDIDLFMKPAGYANFNIVFAHGQDGAGIFGEGSGREETASHCRTRQSNARLDPKAVKNWYEILTMPGVAIGGGNWFLDPGAYRAPMIFQLAEAYYKVPNLYNNMLGHVVIPGADPTGTALGRIFDFQFTYEHNARATAAPIRITVTWICPTRSNVGSREGRLLPAKRDCGAARARNAAKCAHGCGSRSPRRVGHHYAEGRPEQRERGQVSSAIVEPSGNGVAEGKRSCAAGSCYGQPADFRKLPEALKPLVKMMGK